MSDLESAVIGEVKKSIVEMFSGETPDFALVAADKISDLALSLRGKFKSQYLAVESLPGAKQGLVLDRINEEEMALFINGVEKIFKKFGERMADEFEFR